MMPSMVVVVVPLCAVFALCGIGSRIEQTRAVVIILEHEMDQPSTRCRKLPDCAAEVMQQREPLGFEQSMHRVETEAVEPIVLEPMQRVVDREGADLRNAIVDGMSPRRVSGCKECRSIAV